MNFKLLQALQSTLEERHLLVPKLSIMVAISGGQDSSSLLLALYQLQKRWGWHLIIIHANHLWTPMSFQGNWHMIKLANFYKLNYISTLPSTKVFNEEAAREWRNRIFERIATWEGCDVLITAHTSSDRSETILFNVLRGSSPKKLGNLDWIRKNSFKEVNKILSKYTASSSRIRQNIACVRPCLNLNRSQLQTWNYIWQVPVWIDPTNTYMRWKRNRIRYELVPYIRTNFNPQIDRQLSKVAELSNSQEKSQNNLETYFYSKSLGIPNLEHEILRSQSQTLYKFLLYRRFNCGYRDDYVAYSGLAWKGWKMIILTRPVIKMLS
jgi:tRNA(Ile)-lysidine synthase